MEEQNERDEEIKAVCFVMCTPFSCFNTQATERLSKAELQEYKRKNNIESPQELL